MTEVEKQKFRNDSEFYEIVRTFHELVTEINKSFHKGKKQYHKKNNHHMKQVQIQKKTKQIQKKPINLEFGRNQYHIKIAYKIFYLNSTSENSLISMDQWNPLQQSMKIVKQPEDIDISKKYVQIVEQQLEKKEAA
ncbi:unnamed protein product [Paramecium pentaurelia]|uniref:Uncharacterized protein n=1 Tax=Paramecium pentaurelia TaxID=43138 RepID=A0A8S1TG62_9CILI|nr:unnamed protein product [Paramecium pentaurelia]